ncbi:MazG-like family protein [Streptomyces sp. URMC 126]|uniref:MazG-like family protein n=1 Tax=Streptomyces sp. URMC 126 TaxID=3423401 RepID=UPI003F1D8A66
MPSGHDSESALWAAARRSADALDAVNGTSAHETALRLLKIGEEVGEVVQAYLGMTGQNPRKGVTHGPSDVAAELCDVILTAATALHLFTDDPPATLASHARRVRRRVEQWPGVAAREAGDGTTQG